MTIWLPSDVCEGGIQLCPFFHLKCHRTFICYSEDEVSYSPKPTSYPIEKQSKIIIACTTLHNSIRDSALHDANFENYVTNTDEDNIGGQYSTSGLVDNLDMGSFSDST
jgi:hypothetical protein